MTQEELNEILKKHELWLEGKGGMRADLHNVYLGGANLRHANLKNANLVCAMLYRADLRGANLTEANLYETDLNYADLRGANLEGADLTYANLHDTYLDKKELIRKGIIVKRKMIGWKKCQKGVLVKLEIPKGAIVFSINNKKCRTNIAKVIDIIGAEKGISQYEHSFIYKKGKTYKIDDFDLIYNVECSTGIHFFRTKKEAKEYD